MHSVLKSNIVGTSLAGLSVVAVGTALEPSGGLSSPPAVTSEVLGRAPVTGAPLELVPDRALVKLAVGEPGQLLDALADQPLTTALRALPGGAAQGLRKLEQGLAEVERELGTAPRALLDDLAGGGGVFWLDLKNLKPDYGLVLRGSDEDASRAALERLLDLAADRAGYPNAFDAPTSHREGVDLWQLGDDAAAGWRDGLAMLAPSTDAVLATLGSAAARKRDRARGHWSPVGPPLAIHAQIDMERARLLSEFGDDDGLRELVAMPDTPEGQLLLGPSLTTIARGDTLDAWLTADASGIEFGLSTDGLEVVAPRPSEVAIAPSPNDLLYAHLRREPGVLVDGSLELTDDANAKLAKGLSQFEVLMGGLDLRRDVLPRLGPTVHMIAREIPYRSGPTPELRLPAIAFVMKLDEAEQMREPLVAAFQNAIVLSNVDRAQKGEGRPFLLRRAEVDDDGAVTAAHYSRPRADEPVDMIYNVAPSCAATGQWLIVASHEDLLDDLLDELPTQATTRAQPVGDSLAHARAAELLVLDGSRAVELLRSQRSALELTLGLRRGVSEERASEIVDAIAALLEAQSRLSMELAATPGEGLALVTRLESGGGAE